ncbi:neutral/alkaline non-lysosomal ceramidase C-terminal domain-containing protein, partial [Ralstonia solanacearum species complex bacterium KE100]
MFDDVPPGQHFGDVLTQPDATCSAGSSVRAVFRGGHPKNDLRT